MGCGASVNGMEEKRPAGSAVQAVRRLGSASNKYRVKEQEVSDRRSPQGGRILVEDQNFGCDLPLWREIDADLQEDIQGAGSSRTLPGKLPVKPSPLSNVPGLDDTQSTQASSTDQGELSQSWDDCLREKHPEWAAAFDLCATGEGDKMRLSGDAIRRALRRAVPDASDREVRVAVGDESDVGDITWTQFYRLAAALAGSGSPPGTAYSIQGLEKAREESRALKMKARKEITRGLARSKSNSVDDLESTPSEAPTEVMRQAEDLFADETCSIAPTEVMMNQAEALLMDSPLKAAPTEATDLLLAAQQELAAQMEMFQDKPAEVMVVHPGADELPVASKEMEDEEEELAFAPYELADLPNIPAHLKEPVPTERPITAESYAEAATMMDRLRAGVLHAARAGTLGRALAVLHLVHPRQWKCEEGLETIAEEDRETAAEAADAALEGAVIAHGSVECQADTSLIAGEASILEDEPVEEPVVPKLVLSGGTPAEASNENAQKTSARNSGRSSARRTPRVGPPPPLPPFKPPEDYAVKATPRDRSARGPAPLSARGPTPRANTPVAAPAVPPPPPPVPVALLGQGTPRKEAPRSAREHAEWAASSQSRWGSVLDSENPAQLLSARRISAGTPRAELKACLQPAETAETASAIMVGGP